MFIHFSFPRDCFAQVLVAFQTDRCTQLYMSHRKHITYVKFIWFSLHTAKKVWDTWFLGYWMQVTTCMIAKELAKTSGVNVLYGKSFYWWGECHVTPQPLIFSQRRGGNEMAGETPRESKFPWPVGPKTRILQLVQTQLCQWARTHPSKRDHTRTTLRPSGSFCKHPLLDLCSLFMPLLMIVSVSEQIAGTTPRQTWLEKHKLIYTSLCQASATKRHNRLVLG